MRPNTSFQQLVCVYYTSLMESTISSSRGSKQVYSAVDLQIEDMSYPNFTIVGLQT